MKEKEGSASLQTSASNLIVAIGKKYVKEVFTQLQKNFVAGHLPHLYVLKTMANLAEINRKLLFKYEHYLSNMPMILTGIAIFPWLLRTQQFQ